VGLLSRTASASSYTFGDIAKRWLESLKPTLKPSSYRRRETSVAQLRPYLGTLNLRQVDARVCEGWAAKRSPGAAASTYNNERDVVIAILAYAQREGLLIDNPAKVLARRKLSRTQLIIPTRTQYAALLQSLRNSDGRYQEAANLVELLATSGMRLAEATALRWRDVDFAPQRFTVTGGELGTKNHEARVVPLFPKMRAYLESLRSKRQPADGDLVISIANAKNAMAHGCKAASLPDFTHHSLRHYFVSNAIEAGVDFKTIAVWVRHKDGGLLVAKTYGPESRHDVFRDIPD
jgi:integrase